MTLLEYSTRNLGTASSTIVANATTWENFQATASSAGSSLKDAATSAAAMARSIGETLGQADATIQRTNQTLGLANRTAAGLATASDQTIGDLENAATRIEQLNGSIEEARRAALRVRDVARGALGPSAVQPRARRPVDQR